MLKVLYLMLLISLFGCSNVVETAQVEVDKPQIAKKIQACDFNIEEKLRIFYSPIPDEFRDDARDSKVLEEIKNCPREEIVNSIVSLQNSKKHDLEIQAKSAYLLIKLKHEHIANQKTLFSLYDKVLGQAVDSKEFTADRMMDLICGVILEDDPQQEFLSDGFDLALKSDNFMADQLSFALGEVFERSPADFLKKLKPKSNKIRQKVYAFLFYSMPEDKIFQHLTSASKDSEVYSMIEEIQKFAKNKKTIINND